MGLVKQNKNFHLSQITNVTLLNAMLNYFNYKSHQSDTYSCKIDLNASILDKNYDIMCKAMGWCGKRLPSFECCLWLIAPLLQNYRAN